MNDAPSDAPKHSLECDRASEHTAKDKFNTALYHAKVSHLLPEWITFDKAFTLYLCLYI